MDSERIPAGQLTQVKSWTLPEIGTQKVVYEASREGVSSAEFPTLNRSGSDQSATDAVQNKGRLRVTEQQLEVLLKEAHEAGFEEGRAQGEQLGYQDAAAKGAEQAADSLSSALRAVQAMEAQLPTVMSIHNQTERQLIFQLLEKLVRSVTQTELHIGRANMEGIVAQAVNCLADADQVIAVRVAPDDHELLSKLPMESSWRYVADESLNPGDCVVEARRAMLDHSVEHRIDEALSALRSQLESAN